jgi:hypothetical protein
MWDFTSTSPYDLMVCVKSREIILPLRMNTFVEQI